MNSKPVTLKRSILKTNYYNLMKMRDIVSADQYYRLIVIPPVARPYTMADNFNMIVTDFKKSQTAYSTVNSEVPEAGDIFSGLR